MAMTDPIADMLTRIRNANQMRYLEVEVPASNIKTEIARILKEEGFISDYKIKKNDVQDVIVLNLKGDFLNYLHTLYNMDLLYAFFSHSLILRIASLQSSRLPNAVRRI